MKISSKRLVSAVCGFGLLVCAFNAAAFDGYRSGFFVGIGAGAFGADVDASGPSFLGEVADAGFALSLRAGFGINDNFLVYFLRDFQADNNTGFGLTGVGSTVYFGRGGPSPYLIGALGFGDVSDDNFSTNDGFGFAAMLGAGYAFTRAWHVDFSVLYVDAELDDSFGPDVDFEIVSYRLMARFEYY